MTAAIPLPTPPPTDERCSRCRNRPRAFRSLDCNACIADAMISLSFAYDGPWRLTSEAP